jgi:putative glutamine amidotransferase
VARPLIGICTSIQHGTRRGDAYFLYSGYVEMVSRAGGLPFLLPVARSHEEAVEVLGRIDGLLLTGGDDLDPVLYGQTARHPELLGSPVRAGSEIAYARASLEGTLPTLGVCLGIQTLNVAFGGTLLQFIPEDVPGALRHEAEGDESSDHPIRIEPDTWLARIAGVEAAVVNSFHHQAVERPAPGFRVSARSPEGIIEAIEREDPPFCVGVQWHPERMPEAALTARLLRAFVDAARRTPAA